jgi:outer membrane protein assembly factor BamB
VVAGQVYAGNADGNLYRIDSDGGVVWKVALGAAVTGDPVFVGGRIVAGLANGRIVAVAAE